MPKSYMHEIKNNLKYTYKDKFIVIEPVTSKKKSLFCNICTFVLKTFDDIESFENFGCCHACYLKWAESRRASWKNEKWRPQKEEVQQEIEIRNKLLQNLNLED